MRSFSRFRFFKNGLLAAVAACSVFSATVITPAERPKTFHNPILSDRDLADPDVLQVGSNYYLYATSDGKGYEVFQSTNLVDWQSKGEAFTDPRGGAWAPDLFYDERGDKKFYLYYTDTATNSTRYEKHKQIGVAVSSSPLGPFVDKAVLAAGSIDAHLFQDDDGRYYLYYVEIEGGFKIFAQRMASPTRKIGERTKILYPTEPWEKVSGDVTEGPFMLKHNGTYYLMYSGTAANTPNYGIGYATSKSPLGPFTKFAGNPIVHRDAKVIAPGHHCVVEGPDKKLWLVYHQKRTDDISWPRYLAVDPMWFDDKGVIHALATKGVEQPIP